MEALGQSSGFVRARRRAFLQDNLPLLVSRVDFYAMLLEAKAASGVSDRAVLERLSWPGGMRRLKDFESAERNNRMSSVLSYLDAAGHLLTLTDRTDGSVIRTSSLMNLNRALLDAVTEKRPLKTEARKLFGVDWTALPKMGGRGFALSVDNFLRLSAALGFSVGVAPVCGRKASEWENGFKERGQDVQ